MCSICFLIPEWHMGEERDGNGFIAAKIGSSVGTLQTVIKILNLHQSCVVFTEECNSTLHSEHDNDFRMTPLSEWTSFYQSLYTD